MKKIGYICLILILGALVMNTTFAKEYRKKDSDTSMMGMRKMGMQSGGMGMMYGEDGSLDKRVFKKLHLLLLTPEEFDLSEQQIGELETLKLNLKKELINKKAQIEIKKLDIYSLLKKASLDRDKIEELINQKYDLKKEKALFLIDTYIDLKGIVNQEQLDTLKEKYKENFQKKMFNDGYKKMRNDMDKDREDTRMYNRRGMGMMN